MLSVMLALKNAVCMLLACQLIRAHVEIYHRNISYACIRKRI